MEHVPVSLVKPFEGRRVVPIATSVHEITAQQFPAVCSSHWVSASLVSGVPCRLTFSCCECTSVVIPTEASRASLCFCLWRQNT